MDVALFLKRRPEKTMYQREIAGLILLALVTNTQALRIRRSLSYTSGCGTRFSYMSGCRTRFSVFGERAGCLFCMKNLQKNQSWENSSRLLPMPGWGNVSRHEFE